MNQLSFEDAIKNRDPIKSLSGSEMMKRAMEWRSVNINAWSRMKEIAIERIREGRRFSIAELAEEARYRMRTKGHDQGFKINNSLRAALARLLIKELPPAADYMEIRSSRVDWR